MSSKDKLAAAIQNARREWLAAFDNNIEAMTGGNRHGELSASVVIFNGLPAYVDETPRKRKSLADAPHDGARS